MKGIGKTDLVILFGGSIAILTGLMAHSVGSGNLYSKLACVACLLSGFVISACVYKISISKKSEKLGKVEYEKNI